MGTLSIGYIEPTVATSEVESESESRQLSDLPKLDASSSPLVATPLAPQRAVRTRRHRGGDLAFYLNGCATTPRSDVTTHAAIQNREDIGAISKDLLVIALEEENDRLRSALDSERRARQLAEARARHFEQLNFELQSKLSQAQQQLEELEQEAFRRAMVLNWLDTATPQRRGSVDQGLEESTGSGSAVFAEARLCAKPTAFGAIDAASAAELAKALICPHADEALEAEVASDADGRLPGATCATPAGKAGTPGAQMCDDAGQDSSYYGAALEPLALKPTTSVPTPPGQVDRSASPTAPGDCGGGVNGPVPTAAASASAAASVGGTHGPTRGGCHASWHMDGCSDGVPADNLLAAWAATPAEGGVLRRACTVGGERRLGGSGGDGGPGLSPQRSLPLQAEKHPLPGGQERPAAAQALLQGGQLHAPPGGGARPASAELLVPSVAATAAASLWMPVGAARCHNWGPEPLPPGPQAPVSHRPFGHHSTRPAADVPGGGPLLTAFGAPGDGAHVYPYSYLHPHSCPDHQHRNQPPVPWSGSSSLRVADRARLRGGSAVLRSAFNAAATTAGGGFDCGRGGGGGGGAIAIESYCSAPVGSQDGGEWCTIPLGSPVRTPKKGNGSRAGNP